MRLRRASLEDWMREFYFATRFDLGSSGVPPWSLAQLRELAGIDLVDLDRVVMDDGESFGALGLRAAIARRWSDGDPERVLATHGSSEAIFCVMNALLAPGDEVVAVQPGYHSLSSVAEAIGCRVAPWPLRAEDGFRPDLDDLRARLGPGTRMVVVNFPHNPTGATLTPAEQGALVEIVAEHGAYLVWDAAFAELTYGSPPLPDPAGDYERCLSVGTMSKAYGLPGLRLGWCIAAPALLARVLPLRDAMTLSLSPLVEYLGERAVVHADRLRAAPLAAAGRNLAALEAWVARNPSLVEWTAPRGGVTAFPRLVSVPDVEGLCRSLGHDHKVLLVPGSCFGHPDRVRLGFGGATDDFAEGLALLEDVLRDGQDGRDGRDGRDGQGGRGRSA